MRVIPVIDVKDGLAVAAVAGDRANYRPLQTPFSPGSHDPVAVALGMASRFDFDFLYIADLDGIEGRQPDLGLVRRMREALPKTELWIDNGAATSEGVSNLLRVPHTVAVVGSETLCAAGDLQALRQLAQDRLVLSLDFRGDTFVGPPELLQDATIWPARLIVMTLARIGRGEGPDFSRLQDIVVRAGLREVYAAGGVRHRQDLETLQSAGIAGALVASALHSGNIKAGDLIQIAGSSCSA